MGINWYPGHMAKAKREIREQMVLIDIVYELIDARIPFSSKNPDLEELTKNKPKLLIMTKSDLCDMSKTNKFKLYYERLGYKVFLINSLTGENIDKILKHTMELSKVISEKRASKGLKKRKTRIAILGVPNVGKSTLINKLSKSRKVRTGNSPGVTRIIDWIKVNDDLEILDTPGVLEPRLKNEEVALNLASMTVIKGELLDNEAVGLYIINKLLKEYPERIINRYKLKDTTDIDNIILDIAKKIGARKHSGIDYEKVYLTVIKDLREGRFGQVTFD